MAKVEVNGASLSYIDEGQGDPSFVFIHGWGGDHRAWGPQFDELKATNRCIAVDLRGRGESDAVPPFDSTTAADDVAEVMRKLGVSRAIVVGHSLGGLIALLLNRRHPDLAVGIVLGDPPLSGASRGSFRELARSIRDAGSLEPVRSIVESWFVESTPQDVRDYVRDVTLGCPPDVAAGMLEEDTVFIEDMVGLLREADAKPFMALWPTRPLGNPDRLRELVTFVRQEPIAEAGHYFQLEQPMLTTALLRAFIDDVERDPRLER